MLGAAAVYVLRRQIRPVCRLVVHIEKHETPWSKRCAFLKVSGVHRSVHTSDLHIATLGIRSALLLAEHTGRADRTS